MAKKVEQGYLVDLGEINKEGVHRYLVNSPHLLFPRKEMAQFYIDSWRKGQPEAFALSYPKAKVIKVRMEIENENS